MITLENIGKRFGDREVLKNLSLTVARGEFAALVLTEGQRTYATPVVKVANTTAGQSAKPMRWETRKNEKVRQEH